MKKVLLFLGMSLAVFYCTASPVSEKKAAIVARNFIAENALFNQKITPVLTLQEAKTDAEMPLFYRYDIDNKGFIIISASDLAHPILAYSFDENFVEHPGTQYILSDYIAQIEALENSKALQNSKIAKLWAYYSATDFVPNGSKGASLKPLVHTRWNQDKFYNTYCPWDAAAGSYYDYRVPNGCVALATAQLMFYYRFPNTGTGGVSYTPAPYPRQTVQFNKAHYEWDAMVNKPQTYTNEIAEVVYHVGVAAQMGYAPDGSGAYTKLAAQRLHENFKYGNMYGEYCRSENQGDSSTYADMLRNYLNGLHPILYSGHAPGGGHAFLLDGYNEVGMFHVNWGWGGSADGYYHIDYLAPGYSGSGFDANSCAILNLQPNLEFYNIACGGFKRQTATSGSVSSGAPYTNYAPQPDCSWMIASPYANQYSFIFNKIHTTPNADIVTIYNGHNESSGIAAQFSGDTVPTSPIVVNADSVLITFRGTAATNSQYKGFSIDYTTTSNTSRCQSIYPPNTDAYTVYSPETIDGKYLPDMNCTWQLRPQYTKGFNFVFYKFDLAEGDFVEIYNATTTPPTLYKRFDMSTDNLPSGIYTVNFNKANIKFISDNYKEKSGFELLEEAILGIEDEIADNMHIYPNPAHNEFIIDNAAWSMEDKVEIYNMLGQLQKGAMLNTRHSVIDVSNLTAGFYLLHITTKNGKMVKKITIQ